MWLQDGTLLDELDRLAVEGRQLGSRDVLLIFRQVCVCVCVCVVWVGGWGDVTCGL
jgi:hypothetical protein